MCGIFGISDNKDASRLAYVGLFTPRHSGRSLEDTLAKNLPKLEGSYAFALLAREMEGVKADIVSGVKDRNFCVSCFTGKYNTRVDAVAKAYGLPKTSPAKAGL